MSHGHTCTLAFPINLSDAKCLFVFEKGKSLLFKVIKQDEVLLLSFIFKTLVSATTTSTTIINHIIETDYGTLQKYVCRQDQSHFKKGLR